MSEVNTGKTKFYEEAPGKASSMRVAMLAVVFSCCYLAIAGLHLGVDLIQLAALILPMLGVSMGTKAVQKAKEGGG